jgi:hypothetical protein
MEGGLPLSPGSMTLQQVTCSRAIDVDPPLAHGAEFEGLLNVYTSQTALEELAQIVSARSNVVRLHLMRKRRRRLFMSETLIIIMCVLLAQAPE